MNDSSEREAVWLVGQNRRFIECSDYLVRVCTGGQRQADGSVLQVNREEDSSSAVLRVSGGSQAALFLCGDWAAQGLAGRHPKQWRSIKVAAAGVCCGRPSW